MTLIVTKVSEAFYTAEASPPHVHEKWETEKPLQMHQLLDRLLALGIHQIDAFFVLPYNCSHVLLGSRRTGKRMEVENKDSDSIRAAMTAPLSDD
jgi:hypothetical protein